jgi:uncharacterized protein YyaL (SSP411 family)
MCARPTTDDATPNVHAVYAQALLKLSSLTGQTSLARGDRQSRRFDAVMSSAARTQATVTLVQRLVASSRTTRRLASSRHHR